MHSRYILNIEPLEYYPFFIDKTAHFRSDRRSKTSPSPAHTTPGPQVQQAQVRLPPLALITIGRTLLRHRIAI